MRWLKKNFFKYIIALILILLAIFLFGQIDFFLIPFKKFIAILFFPLLISGLFYYLLRPPVRLLESLKVPRVIAIIIVFVITLLLIALMVGYSSSILTTQINQLIQNIPGFIDLINKNLDQIVKNDAIAIFPNISFKNIQAQFNSFLETSIPLVSTSILTAFSAVTGIATVLIIVPFVIFYFLKDDRQFGRSIMSIMPEKHRKDIKEILLDIDDTLSSYIVGQFIIAFLLGALTYIAYLIIGVDYSLILALFAMITTLIPIFGSIIGLIPALLVGLASSTSEMITILIASLIIQNLVFNVFSPHFMGKRLSIHPLTFIFILLGVAALYGFVGMLIAIPVYAVLKIVIKNFIRIYKISMDD